MKLWSNQPDEKGPFASLRSIASLQLAYGVWLIAYGSYVSTIRHKLLALCEVCVPRNWTLLTGPKNPFPMLIKE